MSAHPVLGVGTAQGALQRNYQRGLSISVGVIAVEDSGALLRRLAVRVLCDQPQGSTVLSVCPEGPSSLRRRA